MAEPSMTWLRSTLQKGSVASLNDDGKHWRPVRVTGKTDRYVTLRPLTGPIEEMRSSFKFKWEEVVGVLSPYDLTDRNVVLELLVNLLNVGFCIAERAEPKQTAPPIPPKKPKSIAKLKREAEAKSRKEAKEASDKLVHEFLTELEHAGWPKYVLEGMIAQAGYLSHWGKGGAK